eukprot:4131278-Pleurochrysis_carterae.AAC.2
MVEEGQADKVQHVHCSLLHPTLGERLRKEKLIVVPIKVDLLLPNFVVLASRCLLLVVRKRKGSLQVAPPRALTGRLVPQQGQTKRVKVPPRATPGEK